MRTLLVILFSISLSASGQRSVVSADKMNVLYVGVPNPVSIVAEGHSCEEITVTIDGATIINQGPCSYDIQVSKPDLVVVKVVLKSGKPVGEHRFRVKYIPDPTARVGGKRGGYMPANMFKAQLGVVATMDGFDFDTKFTVTGYEIQVSRGRETIYSGSNKGARFNDAARECFSRLRGGDKVFISEIKAVGPDSRTRILNDIELMLQ